MADHGKEPADTGSVGILGTRLNTNMDIGTFAFTGAGSTNHGDAVITVDTTWTLASRTARSSTSLTGQNRTIIISPTPPNNTGITVNYFSSTLQLLTTSE